MPHYLFVHFREKTSPDGEQVHFAVSRDGFHWQALNGGHPVLWAYYGDRGVRDMTIVRDHTSGKFHISRLTSACPTGCVTNISTHGGISG